MKLFIKTFLIGGMIALIIGVIIPGVVGARYYTSDYGLPGIYNTSTTEFVSGGQGTALNVDSMGRLILSTSTSISVNFASNLLPSAHNTYDVGSGTRACNDVFASGTIYANSVTSSQITPWANNTFDLCSYQYAWRNIYASGTVFAAQLNIARNAQNPFYVGDSNTTTTITVGSRGASTSTFYSDLSVVFRDAIFGGAADTSLWVGNGSATTTIRGGNAGLATSTFRGDVDIQNLYTGTFSFNTDAGVVDAFNIPVSASAANGTREGYAMLIDGFPLLTVWGTSDGLGNVTSTGVGIRTQTPSSTLHVGNDYFDKVNNRATSSLTVGMDRISPACLVLQDTDRGGLTYCTAINGVLTCSQTVCTQAIEGM